MKKITSIVLAIALCLSLTLIFTSCSAESYREEGDYYKAYQIAVEDGDVALQERLVLESMLYAVRCSREGNQYIDKISAVYYLIYTGDDEIINKNVVLEYEEKDKQTKDHSGMEHYKYHKYELYNALGEMMGYDDKLWDEERDALHSYNIGKAENVFSTIKDYIDIALTVNKGKKLTVDEYQSITALDISKEDFRRISNGEAPTSLVTKEKSVDSFSALDGKWELNDVNWTWGGYILCSVTGQTYRTTLVDDDGDEILNGMGANGTVSFDGDYVIFTTENGTIDFRLLYKMHRGYIILLDEYAAEKYNVVAKVN